MNLKHFFSLLLISSIFFLNACGEKSQQSNFAESNNKIDYLAKSENGEINYNQDKTKITQNQPTKGETTQQEKIETKIIKTANISIEIDNYKESKEKVKEIVKKYTANISQENEYSHSTSLTNNYIIRVSKEKFEELVNDIVQIAKKIDSKTISSEDVTEEYIDINARLKNKKEVEKQYVELLKRANTVGEIINVNEHLRIIREEIESKEGRMKYINDRVALSTINLTIYQNLKTDYGFFTKIIEAIQGGWNGLLIFIIGVFYIWPFLFIIAIIWIVIWRSLKKRKQKQKENKTSI